MLAREDDILMIPVIGTGFGVVKEGIISSVMVEEGIISSMMVWDDALSWFETVATLMGERTILALVSIQKAV
jgi:hypothetical protein